MAENAGILEEIFVIYARRGDSCLPALNERIREAGIAPTMLCPNKKPESSSGFLLSCKFHVFMTADILSK